jgi:hypothetical protein
MHKTVLFFAEKKCCGHTEAILYPIFKRDGRLPSIQFIKFIASLIMMTQFWKGNVVDLHLCVLRRTLTLSEWRCTEAPVNQQGRLQHNWGYPDDRCNEFSKVVWICIHTKRLCCLNLQFKINIKKWHLLNGLGIMRYHSTMFVFLMTHTSTSMVWLMSKICDFGRQRIHVIYVREGASSTENYSVDLYLKSCIARANFLWKDSEQWTIFKYFA